MKKFLFGFLFLVLIFASSCSRNNPKNVVESLGKMSDKLDSYQVEANMEIKHNGSTSKYNISVLFKGPDYYKVSLTNLDNNNLQVILKNKDGVYVLTPALNKSFQFQSEWPMNTSHAYLFQSLVKDIVNEEEPTIIVEDDEIIIETKVDYKMDKSLKTQKIIFDKKTLYPKEVIVFDETVTPVIKVTFTSFEKNKDISLDEFNLESSMETAVYLLGVGYNNYERQIIRPTYIPMGAYLTDEKITDSTGIMTFDGDISFTVIESFVNEGSVVSNETVYGDPIILESTVGAISNNSITFIKSGVEYIILSDDLSYNEFVQIANSFVYTIEK